MIRGKIFIATFFLIMICCGLCAAAPIHKITSFSSRVVYENGADILRLEIGLARQPVDYVIYGEGILRPKRLLIELSNTEIGSLKTETRLNPAYAKSMTAVESGRHNVRITIDMNSEATAENYRVYTAPPSGALPYRIVIDVYGSGGGKKRAVKGLRGRVIVIDPGHGGADSGAIGVGGLLEKDVTLSVSKKVQSILESSGVKVVMTRETDRDVFGPSATDTQELQARVNYGAAEGGADVFVSIHCNAFSDPAANGTGTYYFPKSLDDVRLARSLQNAMVEHGGRRNRGIHEARFYVCRHSMMPAALAELAFITNYVEGNLLADEDFQNELALGIAEGLSNYFSDTDRRIQ